MQLYYDQKLSMQQIAARLGCSMHKVVYWMDHYNLERRDWSEATYVYRNPDGDRFRITLPKTSEEKELFALALGLYMGEGVKTRSDQVAIANTNPAIHRIFLLFLETFCGVNRSHIRAWINIYDDCDTEMAIRWWANEVGLSLEQFYTTTARPSRGGTYTKKSEYGTLSTLFLNTKLKKVIDSWCIEYQDKFFTSK